MLRWAIFSVAALIFACKGKSTTTEETNTETNNFSKLFKTASAPYILTDTVLLQNDDTTVIRSQDLTEYIPDSIRQSVFGKKSKLKFTPIARIEVPKAETYYIVKATSGSKKAAFLLSFDKENNFGAAFPFLIPDADASTYQSSSIDKAYSIYRNVYRKQDIDNVDVVSEGKDVYVYNNDAKQFTLIMTDLLDDSELELINPIDTFPMQSKFTGDYIKDKRNIVSVRDGRRPNTLLVFIHTEKNKGDCTGELKGEAEVTGNNIAVYRQAGDPCVLQLTFSSKSVSLQELEGCGSRRGLECAFDGAFPRKKEAKGKSSEKSKQVSANKT